jgi:hypothetical protein
MTTLHLKAKVDQDGKLRMVIPIGTAEAGSEVDVTIEASRISTLTVEERLARVRRTAGSIQDPSFKRPKQPLAEPPPELD